MTDYPGMPLFLDHAHINDTPGASFYEVFVDGIQVRYCFEADVTEGWAKCYLTDVLQPDLISRDSEGFPVTSEIRGMVVIRRRGL